MNQTIHPADIVSCESEALHTIGYIQNHSYLIAVEVETLKITHHSNNIIDLLKSEVNLLGANIEVFDQALKTVGDNNQIVNLLKVSLSENNLKVNNPYQIKIGEIVYHVILNLTEKILSIEFEPKDSTVDSFNSENILGEVLMQLNFSESDFSSIFQFVATKVKSLINYDRVMIYKFHEDFHGEVIAEAKNDELGGFFGMHFPATDIPRQARELYVKNITRILVDVNSTPVPIVSNSNQPLDLSYAQSRAISLMHIEYLKNMGVKASYSISLVVDNKLWGLIACHNYNHSGFIDYNKRSASKIISQYVSNLLTANYAKSQGKEKSERLQVIDQLDKQMREGWDVQQGLFKHPDLTLSVCNAEGFALIKSDVITLEGNTPNLREVQEIAAYLKADKSIEEVHYETNLSSNLDTAKSYKKIASGILAMVIQKSLGEYIIWFKPEFKTKVEWGGKDNKEYVEDLNGKFRLSPRKSFEKWEESVDSTSTSWSSMDIKSVQWLRNKILAVYQHKANIVSKLNTELTAAYEELDSFSYTLSHDLKTPLTIIKGYLEILEGDLGEDNPIILKMTRNTEIMQDMVSNVLAYSKLGREGIDFKTIEILPILEEIKHQMKDSRSFENVNLLVPVNTVVSGNKMMIYQVFLNLIENAVKYKDPEKDSFVSVEMEDYSSDFNLFKIIDNGYGIDSKHFEKVFGLFKQGVYTGEIEGSGAGLAIVKKIVTKHEGRVWVESTKGIGSTFNLLLKK